jgi:hypothetical protein
MLPKNVDLNFVSYVSYSREKEYWKIQGLIASSTINSHKNIMLHDSHTIVLTI